MPHVILKKIREKFPYRQFLKLSVHELINSIDDDKKFQEKKPVADGMQIPFLNKKNA